MRVLVTGLLVLAISVAGFAQPLAGEGISLADAKLPSVVRKQMERELFSGMSNRCNREDVAETSKVLRVHVGPSDRWGWRMRGGYQLCGRGANCPFWIFDGKSGGVLLRGEGGFDFRFLRKTHAGLYDVRILQSMGAVDPPVAYRYEFDGRHHVEVKKADSLRK